ncbi:MAG: plasmid recombination protein [Lachnospiraceae bacterium]|nr:plasmid recombination protein [Lachnospiraceae bacterium]
MMGKGSVNHNTRAFSTKNVDKERSEYNVEFCNTDIKKVYHVLFDEAKERYNAKQKRSDRKIDNYYEKIRQSKQEKLFYEVIFQIGNKDDMNAKSEEGKLAREILIDFMKDFQKRNPNLYVFSAHLHMDEETPHIHIDFVPFIRGSKRGLDTRVSLKGALAEQGFKGGTRGATEWNQWIEAEKLELSKVMERYGVQRKQLGTHNKHLSVLDFEKQERTKEVAKLDKQIEKSETELFQVQQLVDNRLDRAEELAKMGEQLQEKNDRLLWDNSELEKVNTEARWSNARLTEENKLLQTEINDLAGEKVKLQSGNRELEEQQQKLQAEIEAMAGSKVKLERNVRAYDEEEQWRLPESGAFTSAKSYRENSAKPLVTKLKELVKSLTIKCVNLMEQVKRLKEKVTQQTSDIEWYKGKLREQAGVVEQLQEKVVDLERVKRYAGAEKVQSMIDSVKEIERLENEQKRLQRNYNRGMSR